MRSSRWRSLLRRGKMQNRLRLVVLGLIAWALLCSSALAQTTSAPNPLQTWLASLRETPYYTQNPKKDDDNGNGKKNGDDKKDEEATWYSVHGQATIVSQGHWLFTSPYTGTNSFPSKQEMQTSATVTLFLRSEERRVGKECRSRWEP